MLNPNTHAQTIQTTFETLSPATLPALVALYAADARFTDPFNDVQGAGKIHAIFRHMFTQVREPRFTVTKVIASDADIFMRWDFHFLMGKKPGRIHGSTHFELNSAGLITLHRDYWDAAQELYEKLPVLGSVLRLIRRKLGVH
jgi:steroid Delta-isomerase